MVFWKGPTPCSHCSETVYYIKGRRRCYVCGKWAHDRCSVSTGTVADATRSVCMPCVHENPKKVLKRVARDMNGGKDGYPESMLAVIWSAMFSQDEEEISSRLGIPLDKVHEWGDRLRENGVWGPDGVDLGEEPDADFAEVSVCVILASLCATGQVQRERVVGGDGEAVPDDGGNEDGDQDHEQEAEDRGPEPGGPEAPVGD